MAVEDEEKTAFVTPFGPLCYTAMTFGLKNAGATYQRCMQECLASQIGRNIHVYIDDVVVKSARQGDLLADLAETFANQRRYKIKLNPGKCTFGVPTEQLLGYVVSKRGIEANPARSRPGESWLSAASSPVRREGDALLPPNAQESHLPVGQGGKRCAPRS